MKLIKIENIEQFVQFVKNSKMFEKNIILNLDILDEKKNAYYSKLINENKNACGCETGTVFMLISIITTILLIISNYQVFKVHYFLNSFYGLIFIFGLSIIGKLIGLGIAKLKLKKTLNEIKNIAQQGISVIIICIVLQ